MDYRIKSGDTLSAIARRNQTMVGALMKGSQRISYTQMNYPIMSIHQYRG